MQGVSSESQGTETVEAGPIFFFLPVLSEQQLADGAVLSIPQPHSSSSSWKGLLREGLCAVTSHLCPEQSSSVRSCILNIAQERDIGGTYLKS